MDLEVVNIITYVCAALGAILLVLCIILAAFFVYSHCKKCSSGANVEYVIVPSSSSTVEQTNGQPIVLRKLSTEELKGGILKNSISFETEVEDKKGANNKQNKNVPPVKKKMLWKQKKKSYQVQSIPFQSEEDNRFSEEDLDVPKERLFKSKIKEKRRSKSDWDLYDSDCSEQSNLVKDIDTQQSQYFDALETIEENEEVENADDLEALHEASTLIADNDDHLWEDVPEIEEKAEKRSEMEKKVFPKRIKMRINALKVLQHQHETLEAKFYVDLYELEAKMIATKKEPLYAKRRQIIDDKDEFGENGIEGFWLQAMDNCDTLRPIIQLHDRPILKSLYDIQVKTSPLLLKNEQCTTDNMGFRIEFYFHANDYFDNAVLYKDYALRCDPEESLLSFEGPEICNCKGCKIHWHKGKNATLRPVKKIRDDKVVKKWAKRSSFFNFFTPPQMSPDAMSDPQKRALFEAHFQIGLFLKETFVPQVIGYYFNMMHKKPSGKMSHDTVKVRDKPTSKLLKSISHKRTSIADSEVQSSVVSEVKSNGTAKHIEATKKDEEDSKSAIVEVFPPPAIDQIAGRYRLVKTENFDEFLKKLGVGMIKRRLANSVSPMNVIIVNEDGSYTVRTESSVRTTELNFNLGVPFKEETLDGRMTETTAIRNGNVLTLDQKGDPSRGEMSTLQIRDFQGDKMLMSLVAEDVVCRRYYEKVVDE